MSGAFSVHVGAETKYAALIDFYPEDDICGEGYDGYSVKITFDDPKLSSDLWTYPDIRADTEGDIKENADTLYNEIVDFFKRVGL